MRFWELVVRNLVRRPLRGAVTVLGIAIAVAAALSLAGLVGGLERTMSQTYDRHGIDLVVVRAGVARQVTSSLEADQVACVAALPHVAHAAGTLCEQTALDPSQPLGIPLRGWPPESFLVKQLDLCAGRRLVAGDQGRAMLGARLAARLRKSPGDRVELAGASFEVIGVFAERDPQESQAAVVPLADLQRLLNRPEQVSEIWVRLEGDADERALFAEKVKPAIEALRDPRTGKHCGLAALPARELVSRGADVRLARALVWAVCATVSLMGTLGVVNAMAQNVHERRRELGALRAIGWGRRRIAGLILSEAGALSICGALGGAGLGWLLLMALSRLPAAEGAVRGELPLALVAMALVATPLLGLAGGLIPARRAAQLTPCEALRHE